MLNFTVGPVMISKEVLKVGREIPYFRTPEFSKTMRENEQLIKEFLKCSKDSRVITLTASGSGAMEAAVINALTSKDRILVINGGSFGERFIEICKTHNLKYTEIKCELGKTLTKEQLYKYDNKGYTALLVNLDETSTGVLYDINLISKFSKKNHIFTLVDSISSFLCDPYNMSKLGINVTITSSQKALAIAPGLSFIALDKIAIDRVNQNKASSFYFDLKKYLKDGERGQTPFTPAVGIILQLNKRLLSIKKKGGVDKEIERTKKIAEYFRNKIIKEKLPFKLFTNQMSNCVTALTPINKNISAYHIFEVMKDKYNIFICPNGGSLKDKVFRVGHIGDIKYKDIDILINAFKDMKRKKII